MIISRQTCNIRVAQRNKKVQNFRCIIKTEATSLVMKEGGTGVPQTYFQCKIHQQLQKDSSSLGKTAFVISVGPWSIDLYLNVCVAPDHALKGLNIILSQLFLQAPCNLARLNEVRYTDPWRSRKKQTSEQKALYNVSSRNVHKLTLSDTISTFHALYCFILVPFSKWSLQVL